MTLCDSAQGWNRTGTVRAASGGALRNTPAEAGPHHCSEDGQLPSRLQVWAGRTTGRREGVAGTEGMIRVRVSVLRCAVVLGDRMFWAVTERVLLASTPESPDPAKPPSCPGVRLTELRSHVNAQEVKPSRWQLLSTCPRWLTFCSREQRMALVSG